MCMVLFQSNTPATNQAFATKMHVSTQEISIQTDDYDSGIQVHSIPMII